MYIAIVCRSYKKNCGINQYAMDLSKELSADIVTSAASLQKKYDVILFQYDINFYLFEDDFKSELAECHKKANEVIFDLHTVLRGVTTNQYPHRKFVKSPFALNRTINAIYIPHFIYPVNIAGKPKPQELRIGTFGFASPSRKMKELLEWGRNNKVDVKVIATINTSGITTESSTTKYAKEIFNEFPNQVKTGFFTHDEIASELEDCSHLIFCRTGDPTIGVSGAVHLAYNVKRPIIIEHKSLAPELKNIYVSRLESLTKDKLLKMNDIPTGGISIQDTSKKILEIIENKQVIRNKEGVKDILYEY